MRSQVSESSDFTEAFAIHLALKKSLKAGYFRGSPAVQRAARRLCKDLQSERSVYGRQLKMIGMLEKGTTVTALGRKLRWSRRTVFRHLNHLEDAGISISLDNNKYRVDKNVPRMLRA